MQTWQTVDTTYLDFLFCHALKFGTRHALQEAQEQCSLEIGKYYFLFSMLLSKYEKI